jgi:hypothetical protein
MARPDKFVTAEHPTRGTLWACVDPSAYSTEGKVAERRFAAFLTPFKNREEARAALIAEGCQIEAVSA